MEENTSRLMVRYTHSKEGQHKNTLVAILDGDDVYFGIARCHLRVDTFVKKMGREAALNRATKMMKAVATCLTNEEANLRLSGECSMENGLCLYWDGLRGHCKRTDIQAMKEYFFTLEDRTAIMMRHMYRYQ
jgi:hypothetical protein